MTKNNLRYLGIGIILVAIGILKFYQSGSLSWIQLLAPFGLGVCILLFVLVKHINERRSDS
jgi:hypothetical protein